MRIVRKNNTLTSTNSENCTSQNWPKENNSQQGQLNLNATRVSIPKILLQHPYPGGLSSVDMFLAWPVNSTSEEKMIDSISLANMPKLPK